MDIKEFIVRIMESGVNLETDSQIIIENDANDVEVDTIDIINDYSIYRDTPRFSISLVGCSIVDTDEYEELKDEVEELKERIEELEKEAEANSEDADT